MRQVWRRYEPNGRGVQVTWVLRRMDPRGGYVARSGLGRSYTHFLENAQRFPTKKAAEVASCGENDRAVSIDAVMLLGRREVTR